MKAKMYASAPKYTYCKYIYAYFFQCMLALKIHYHIFILRCKKVSILWVNNYARAQSSLGDLSLLIGHFLL